MHGPASLGVRHERRGGRPSTGSGAERAAVGRRAHVARGLRRSSLAPEAIGAVALLLDGVGLTLAFWFAAFASQQPAFDPLRSAVTSAAAAVAAVLTLWICGSYRLERLRRYLHGAAMTVTLGLVIAAALGGAWNAAVVVVAFVLPARALGAALAAAALEFGLTERRAVIIGGGARAARIMAEIAASPGADIRIFFGIFDDRDDGRSPPVVSGVPKLGTLASLVAFVRAAEIDMLIVALPLSAEGRIAAVLKAVSTNMDLNQSTRPAERTIGKEHDADAGREIVELHVPAGAGA